MKPDFISVTPGDQQPVQFSLAILDLNEWLPVTFLCHL